MNGQEIIVAIIVGLAVFSLLARVASFFRKNKSDAADKKNCDDCSC